MLSQDIEKFCSMHTLQNWLFSDDFSLHPGLFEFVEIVDTLYTCDILIYCGSCREPNQPWVPQISRLVLRIFWSLTSRMTQTAIERERMHEWSCGRRLCCICSLSQLRAEQTTLYRRWMSRKPPDVKKFALKLHKVLCLCNGDGWN